MRLTPSSLPASGSERRTTSALTTPPTGSRILYVTARYLPYVGGTEIHTAELATRMAAAGHDVTVLATDPHGSATTVECIDGVRVVRVRAWPAQGDLYVAPDVYRWITKGRWDLIHCQGYHTFVAPLAMLAAARSGQPYVLTFHSGGHTSRLRRLIRPVHRRVLRPLFARAERLVGVSAFETALFAKSLDLPLDRFATVPNGSSLPPPRAVPRRVVDASAGDARGRRVICSVGRVEKYKGHQRLVAALPTLRGRVPGVELWIIGDGPFRPAVERLAARLGVADCVRFRPIPPADRGEMASVLQQAELVVSLSDYESHGMAVLEALALGRPVLVSNTAALGELAGSGRLRALPPRCSADELAATIRHCLDEPLLPEGMALPQWDEMAATLDDLYGSVLTAGAEARVRVREGSSCAS